MSEVFLVCRGLSSCSSSMVVSAFFFAWAPGSHSLYPSFVGRVCPALVPYSFLIPSYLAAAFQVVLSPWLTRMQFMTLWPVVMLSYSIGCWLILATFDSLLFGSTISSVVSSSLSDLLLLCRSFGLSVYLGFPPSSPSSFHPSRCRMVFSHGSSPSGVTFSLFPFPSSFGVPVSQYCPLHLFLGVVSPSLHDFLLLGFLLFIFYFAWVAGFRCPGSPLSLCDSVFFLGLTSSSFPASTFLLDSPEVSVFRVSVVLPCDFYHLFSFSFSIRTFRHLPSLAPVSLQFQCATLFFSVGVELVGLPNFFHALHLLSLVFLPVCHFPSFFRLSSASVASPFHSATGSPFGPSQFLFLLFALLIRLSSHAYRPFSMSTSSWFSSAPFTDCGPYFTSSRLGGFPSFLRLVLGLRLAFAVHPASLEGLPFVPSCSLPSCGSSWVFYPFGGPSPPPPPPSVLCCFSEYFLTCWVPYLSLWLFPVSLSACWVSLPCVLRMILFLTSHGYVPAFFWFPSFVTRSNLSSFATGSSLRAESPLSGVRAFFLSLGFTSCLLLLVSFLICSAFSPSFTSLRRFPSAEAGLP